MAGINDISQNLVDITNSILAKEKRIRISDSERYEDNANLPSDDEEVDKKGPQEWGTDASVAAYKNMTPGEPNVDENKKPVKPLSGKKEKVRVYPALRENSSFGDVHATNVYVGGSTIDQGALHGEQGDVRVSEMVSYLGSKGHKHGEDFWWDNGLKVSGPRVGTEIVKTLKTWNPKKYRHATLSDHGNTINWYGPRGQYESKEKTPLEWGTDASVNAYKNMTPGEPTDEGNRVIQATIDAAKKRTILANKKNPKHYSSPEYIAKRKKRDREFPDEIHRILTQVPPKTDAGRKWQAAYKQSLALNNSFIPEEAPPGDKAERFIRKNKADFKERYGENWERVLYATAWKNFGESIEEAVSVDGRTKGYRAAVARISARNERISQAQVEPKSDEQQSDGDDVQQTDEGNRLIGATIKKGKENIAKAKEDERAAETARVIAATLAARGTKPKKGPSKPHPKSTVHTINYPEPHDPKYGPGGRYDTITGKRKPVGEGTNARERGEVQSPRSQAEYDALSPENKKLVDARTKRARKQSMSANPGESPRNKRKKRKPRNRNRNPHLHDPEGEWGEEIEEDAGLRAILDHPSHRKSAKKVRGGDSLSKPEHKRLASAVIGHLAKNKPGHLKRSGDHYEAGEEAIDDLNSSYSPNHGESIEEDRRGETFEVKYAMSKKGPIKVSKFNSHSDAHKFLDQVKKQGFKGMVVSPNFSKGVDRKTESVDFDEGAARDREERVYGSKASQDMNWGVEPEDANTKRSRKNFERQQLAKARAASSNDDPAPKPAGSPEWFAWKRRQKQQNNEYVPEAASKPAPPLPKGMTQKDLEKLTPKQRAKIRNLAGKKEYPHAHRDSNDDDGLDEARSPKEQAEFEKQMKAFKKKGSVKKIKTRGVPKKAPQTRVRGTRPRPSSAGAESKIREEVIDEGGIGSIYPKDKPLRSPTAKAVAKRLSKQRAKLRKKLRGEEIEEGLKDMLGLPDDFLEFGGSKHKPKKRPMSDAQKERRAKHQKLLKITGAKRSKAPRKKARGKTETSKTASRYDEYAPDHGMTLDEVLHPEKGGTVGGIEVHHSHMGASGHRGTKGGSQGAGDNAVVANRLTKHLRGAAKAHKAGQFAVTSDTGEHTGHQLVHHQDNIPKHHVTHTSTETKKEGGKDVTVKVLHTNKPTSHYSTTKITSLATKKNPKFMAPKGGSEKSRAYKKRTSGHTLITHFPGEQAPKASDWHKTGHVVVRPSDHPDHHSNIKSEYTPDHGMTIDERLEEIWRTPDNRRSKDSGGQGFAKKEKEKKRKEYAISRTTGKPGSKPRLVRGGGKSDTQKTLDKIERDYEKELAKQKAGKELGEDKKKTPHWTEREQEAIATERRLAGITPAMERKLQRLALKISKQQRKQEGKKKTEEYELDEMQSGSKKSKVEKTGTHSSNLSYVSGSKHAVGRSSKKEKKRASKEARQARKRRGFGESRVSLTPDEEKEVRKKARADIEKDLSKRKAIRDRDTEVDHWGIRRTKGKPNPADILRNGDDIDWHAHDRRRRIWDKLDKAAERTAKTKRKFGPNKPSETAMARAMRIAQKKKRKK